MNWKKIMAEDFSWGNYTPQKSEAARMLVRECAEQIIYSLLGDVQGEKYDRCMEAFLQAAMKEARGAIWDDEHAAVSYPVAAGVKAIASLI